MHLFQIDVVALDRTCFQQVLQGPTWYVDVSDKAVVEAVIECIKKNILHQDIKMENILLDLDTGVAKIIDSGLGRFFDDSDEPVHSYRGTLYIAPRECFKEGKFNGLEAVIWSLGILLYVTMTSYDPFPVKKRNVPHHDMFRVYDDLSGGAQRLSLRCFTLDPAERPTLEEILNDHF
ncbi:unnamed protein product [Enterobius vermicularis]|uniref:Serine/threonine-protein kinase 1 n=1 Tax=Enterobius vermicularis TaxID=51028 RepID=A0A0N4VQE3_ENTVE|nr:unnamed protein product [Enterobius vermicularis]